MFRQIADQLWRRQGPGVRQLEANLARVIGPDPSVSDLRRHSREGMRSYLRYWLEASQSWVATVLAVWCCLSISTLKGMARCCCRWPGPTGSRSAISCTAHRGPRVSTFAPSSARQDRGAADPASRRRPGLQKVSPASRRPRKPQPEVHQGCEWLYVLNGDCGACSANRTWCSHPARRPCSTPAHTARESYQE
jgi:hypothetical protein